MSKNLTLVLALCALRTLAHADDNDRKKFYFRAGVAGVTTLESSNEMELDGVDGPASLAIQDGPIAGSGAKVNNAVAFAATIGWNTPYLNKRLAIETIIGIPFTLTFEATGTLANESLAPEALGLPTGVMPLGPKLGEAKAIPIVATATYDLVVGKRIRPYAGGGVAVMFATGEKVTNPTLTELGEPDMTVSPAPGLILQGGLDFKVANRVYARLDVKFIAFMYARARVEHVQVATPDLPLFGSTEVGTARMSMWVNPLIIQAGLGTDF
jgi:outer membrane protein W